jgi:hypothetical protein
MIVKDEVKNQSAPNFDVNSRSASKISLTAARKEKYFKVFGTIKLSKNSYLGSIVPVNVRISCSIGIPFGCPLEDSISPKFNAYWLSKSVMDQLMVSWLAFVI